MSIAATPAEILSVNIADTIGEMDRLRTFINLLDRHEGDSRLRTFLICEVEVAAERVWASLATLTSR